MDTLKGYTREGESVISVDNFRISYVSEVSVIIVSKTAEYVYNQICVVME